MNRILFKSSEISENHKVVLNDFRAEHIVNILHGDVGQVLKTGVIDGLIGTSEIEDIVVEKNDIKVKLAVSHTVKSLEPWFDLILCPPRPRAFKRLLPQLASLGVGNIFLVGAEKVEKAYWGAQCMKQEVYTPLLVEGLMQSGTSILPKISIYKNFKRWLMSDETKEYLKGKQYLFVGHPTEKKERPVKISLKQDERILLAIGPEGGWADEEIELLKGYGFELMSLGPRILRTDTAVISLISQLMVW